MALWRFHRTIQAAVTGQLSGEQELRLLAHLKTCLPCRARYDELSRAAQLLSPELAATRERRRLEEALTPRDSRSMAPRRRWLLSAAGVGVAVAALLVLSWSPVPSPHSDDIAFRGGEATAVPDIALLVYARAADAGAVRLVADFPLSTGVRLASHETVQFFARHPWTGAHVVVHLSSGGKQVIAADANVGQAEKHSVAVGPPLSLGPLGPGTWQLSATFEDLQADGGTSHLAATLEVSP